MEGLQKELDKEIEAVAKAKGVHQDELRKEIGEPIKPERTLH